VELVGVIISLPQHDMDIKVSDQLVGGERLLREQQFEQNIDLQVVGHQKHDLLLLVQHANKFLFNHTAQDLLVLVLKQNFVLHLVLTFDE